MISKKAQSENQSPSQQLTPQQEISQLRQQYNAVSELLWEVVRLSNPDTHEISLLPHASDPLWELSFIRAELDGKPDPSGKIRICASTIPEITESQKKRVVRLLRGTSTSLPEAMTQLQIPHPISYVEKKISDRLEWKPNSETDPTAGGIWESVTPPTIMESAKNILHFPK